jgi:hypothetical protein
MQKQNQLKISKISLIVFKKKCKIIKKCKKMENF